MKYGPHWTRAWRATRAFALAACLTPAGFAQFADAHPSNASGDIRVQNKNAGAAHLVFACDRPTSELSSLFTPELIDDLKGLNAGVALSTEDLSRERAQVVRRLNAAGIPVTAWLTLPGNQGYYANAGNAPQTAARFTEFEKWTTDNGLSWKALGLDIEPSLGEFGMFANHKAQLAFLLVRRALDFGRMRRAREAYAALIQQIQCHGYSVQTYQFALIADERRARSTLLERIFGLVDVRGNDEVLMLYTSFNHGIGSALIWQYGSDAQTIAVGSTAPSGNAAADARFRPLNWEEFSRDLIVARHFSPLLGVYSLEGCVRQGFMPRLRTMNWNQPVVLSAESLRKAAKVRRLARTALWIGSHLLYFIAAFLLAIAWLVRHIVLRRRRKRARSAPPL